jgi:hypothetical protein
MLLFLRICHTVDEAIRWPRRASSPWIRRYPQDGFLPARRRISSEVGGCPGPRVGCVQRRAMRRRCHLRRVSGVTIQPVRFGRGSAAAIAPSRVWSSSLSAGRLIWRRKTASWWRNTADHIGRVCPGQQFGARIAVASDFHKVFFDNPASANSAAKRPGSVDQKRGVNRWTHRQPASADRSTGGD